MNKNTKIFLAGHNGMVGHAFHRRLIDLNYKKIITANRNKVDLTNQNNVDKFISKKKPDVVIICAARVGGINANNSYPVEFLYENMMIAFNIIKASFDNNIKKLLFLGSSCIYPKDSKQPIEENSLLSGYLENTNEAYALAKISGIKFCKYISKQYGYDYRSVMPTNLYGKNDNFHLSNSHVIPGLIHRMYLAKINKKTSFKIWGTGKPTREFMHVQDLVDASFKILKISKKKWRKLSGEENFLNIGVGAQISIMNLAKKIKKYINFQGNLEFDNSMPDGMMKKGLSNKKFKQINYKIKYDLDSGLQEVCNWFIKNYNKNNNILRK